MWIFSSRYIISNITVSGLKLIFLLTFTYANNQHLITDFHHTSLKFGFNGDGNYLFHNPSFPSDEKASPKRVATALKWPQPIFSASKIFAWQSLHSLSMHVLAESLTSEMTRGVKYLYSVNTSVCALHFCWHFITFFHNVLLPVTILTVAAFFATFIGSIIYSDMKYFFFYRNKFTL